MTRLKSTCPRCGTPPGDEGLGRNGKPGVCEGYTREEMDTVAGHIHQYFGKFEHVFHDLGSPQAHLDICLVPPAAGRDYCTLVTLGMGAHPMTAAPETRLERAELAIALPKDWQRPHWNCRDDRWYWPVHLLMDLARLSMDGAWLGRGYVADHQKPFAANTWLCAALLTQPFSAAPGGAVCILPGGEAVQFYQVLPLYRNELKYNLEHGTDALLDKMAAIGFVVRPDRPDAITQGILRSAEDAADDILEMDNAIWHLTTLRKKKLPVDELNAFSHMTIYLRWCMEHDLMGAAFLEDYGATVKQVKADPGRVDLRVFLRDMLNGQLFSVFFNQTGRAFASYYYGYAESPPHYPSDIDSYAVSVIGQARNYSREIQDEAYLFLPFDEEYYQAMAQIISRRFAAWQRQSFDPDTLEPSPLARALVRYLGCECIYFPSMKDDDPILAACSYARRDSLHEGFVPVLIRADDKPLWECLVRNADPDSIGTDGYAFDPAKVAAYRKKMLSTPIQGGRAEAGAHPPAREEEIPGRMEDSGENRRLVGYWDSGREMTCPLILAKIPVRNPWEIFAYLPFGNRGSRPDPQDWMAAAKDWFQQYGAVPAFLSCHALDFLLPAPVPREKAVELGAELRGLCPHVMGLGPEDAAAGALAEALQQSTVWHLRWDG